MQLRTTDNPDRRTELSHLRQSALPCAGDSPIHRRWAGPAPRRGAAFDRKREVLVGAKTALREAAAFGRDRAGARTPSIAPWHGDLPSRWRVDTLKLDSRTDADGAKGVWTVKPGQGDFT